MPKNIVIFSDGTGQKGGEGANTNIYKIFNIIEDRTDNQIVFYDPGIGTGGLRRAAQAIGHGFSENIKDCYRFLFKNFESGDQVFLLGFSRGAATVRSLSSFIHHFGVLPKSREDLIEQAYKIYKNKDDGVLHTHAKAFIAKHHTMWTRVKFLGCFDTVAALGTPWEKVDAILNRLPWTRHEFHNFELSASVENAYHALAIDDRREVFHPVLWNTTLEPYQTMRQVWFSGMHTDVGGGYQEHALSDIPLLWLLKKAEGHGLRIFKKSLVPVGPDANGFMHDSRGKWWQKKAYAEKIRSWPEDRADKLVIHQSVLNREKNEQNGDHPPYQPWILDLDYDVEN